MSNSYWLLAFSFYLIAYVVADRFFEGIIELTGVRLQVFEQMKQKNT